MYTDPTLCLNYKVRSILLTNYNPRRHRLIPWRVLTSFTYLLGWHSSLCRFEQLISFRMHNQNSLWIAVASQGTIGFRISLHFFNKFTLVIRVAEIRIIQHTNFCPNFWRQEEQRDLYFLTEGFHIYKSLYWYWISWSVKQISP